MTPRHLVELLLVAALWGGSFLFMRVGAPEFGPVPLIGVRVAIAAAFLLGVLAWQGRGAGLPRRADLRGLFWLGLLNSALPFCLFAWASLGISVGLNSILNATAPMWAALVAYLWLGERLTRTQFVGTTLGLLGVVVLVAGRAGGGGLGGAPLAIGAGLLAALCYGVAVVYTRRRLATESPVQVAAGTQLAAAVMLAPLTVWLWPERTISLAAWASVIALGTVSTGLAFVLYLRLLKAIGMSRAVTVALLIPVFGCLWGALLLGEPVTPRMLVGGLAVLLGTLLATLGAARVVPQAR